MRADALPVVTSAPSTCPRTLGIRLTLLALTCIAIALLPAPGARAASPLSAGPLNVSAGMAQDGRIAVGGSLACAIKSDGTPICWGDNSRGQTEIPADIGTVTQITAGGAHTCAIKTNGTPVCWGLADNGRTTVPPGIGTVTEISAGGAHTCAIKTDGTPVCWGLNNVNQATVPAGTGTVTQISAGVIHTCAIKTDGTPTCWGDNGANRATVPAGTGTVTQISAGDSHTCAVKTDGTPTCWGNNNVGQSAVPAGIGTVTEIAAGYVHTCAAKTDGTPICWGDDDPASTTVPAGTGTVTQIEAGAFDTCAIKTDGTPVCWGVSVPGPLAVPAGIGTVSVPQVSTGLLPSHTCAVRPDGTPVCWGNNDNGQASVPAGIGTVKQISAGTSHTCAIKTDGTPVCWGNNNSGQRDAPAGIGTVTQIAAGRFHTCAIKTDGTPICWGNNTQGEASPPAGTGTVTQIVTGHAHTCAIKTDGTPICWGDTSVGRATVPAGTGTVTQITAGYFHSCAIKTDGTPICWGNDTYGQTTVPPGTGTVTQITAAYFHSCAIKTDGTAVCWGTDNSGQTTVPTGTGTVTQITAAYQHTCAMRTNGTPACWGSNDNGRSSVSITNAPPTLLGAGSVNAQLSTTPSPGRFAVVSGSLPDGLSLSDSGQITGAPTTDGQTATVTITPSADGIPPAQDRTFTITTDITKPTTTDNVPTAWQSTPVTVTLTASDAGGSGVKSTTYEILDSSGTPGATKTYDPANKPALQNGEKIRYRSTDEAGNTEADKTSGPAKVDTNAPSTSDNVPTAWQNSPVTVTLTASDTGGSGVKTTTYEILDGSGTPGTTKTYDPASKPTLTDGEKIRYRTTDEAGNTEADTTSSAAKVDTAAPSTTDDVPAAWQSNPVTVTLTASDAGGSGVKSTTYEIVSAAGTPGATQTYNPASKPVLSDGQRIRYRSTDEAGNVEADKTSSAAKVDTAKPTTSDDVPTTFASAPVTVTLTASDTGGSGVKTTTYEIVSAAGTPGATQTYNPASKPVLSDGQRIRYRSTDEAGNVEADKTSATAKVDTAKPTTSDDVPTAWQNAPVTVTLTASDTGGSGVKTTTYEIVSAAGTSGTTQTYNPAAKPVLGDGERIRYRSTDEAGNTEADKTSAAAKVDTAAPSTSDNVPVGFVSAPVTVTLTASDTGGSGVKTTTYEIVSAAGTAGATETYNPAAKPALSDGQRIRYRSTDEAGNVEADKTSAAAKVDTAKPSTSDDVPAAWQNAPVTVTLTASDTGGSGVKSTTYEIVSAAGTPGATQTYNPASKPVLSDGQRIRYRSTDEAGNVEADKTSGAAKVDTAKPTTSDDVPVGFVSAPVTVTLTASDTGGSGIKSTTYEIVSAAGTPGATQTYDPANKPVLQDGEKVRYRSVDEANNVETDKTSSAAKVDTNAPATSDDVPTSWVNAPVTVTLAATAGTSAVKTTTYEILDSSGTPGATQTYDPASKPVLQNGERIRYRSQSNAGVTEADKTSAAAKVDTSAPSTTDDVPAGYRPGPVTVTLTANDTGGSGLKDTTFEIIDAAGNPGPTKVYDPAAKPALGDGEKIRYRSSDTAGNVEAAKTSAAAKVDAKVPTATITTAPALSSAERSPTVAFTSDSVDATYQCSLDNAPFTTCTSPLTLGPLADGQHTFRVRATSRAGVTGPIATAAFTIAQPVITPAAQTPAASVPAPTLRLLGGGKERQILLNKRWISVRVTCGPVPCTLRIATVLRAKNTTRVRLKTRTITLAANQTRTLKIATTKAQRRIIRRLVGRRGTGGQARFTLTATTTNGTTATTIVRIGLRRLANQ